jgi:hypothetical protein
MYFNGLGCNFHNAYLNVIQNFTTILKPKPSVSNLKMDELSFSFVKIA